MKPRLREAWLKVGGRNQTKLLEGLAKQLELLRSAVNGGGMEVPVRGCRCFVDTEWPTFGKPKSINGFRIFSPKLLAQTLAEEGPLTSDDMVYLVALLESHFTAA